MIKGTLVLDNATVEIYQNNELVKTAEKQIGLEITGSISLNELVRDIEMKRNSNDYVLISATGENIDMKSGDTMLKIKARDIIKVELQFK